MRTRQAFDEQLSELHEELFRIGTMVEGALKQAIQTLASHDEAVATAVIDGDRQINTAVQRLHDRALIVIATQSPMASDLRLISVVLSLLPELERMGDYAATICKVQKRIKGNSNFIPIEAMPAPIPEILREIGQRTTEILHRGLEALRARDNSFAERVVGLDDEIDHLYAKMFKATVTLTASHPDLSAEAIHLLTLAHSMERLGDRVTNVAEQIVYLRTGEIVELNY